MALSLLLLLDLLQDLGEALVGRVQYILDALLLLFVELLHSFAGLALRSDSGPTQVATVVARSQDLLNFNSILACSSGSWHFYLRLLRVVQKRAIVDNALGLTLPVRGSVLPWVVLVWS